MVKQHRKKSKQKCSASARCVGDIEIENDSPVLFIFLEQCEFGQEDTMQIRVSQKRATIVTLGMNDDWYTVISYNAT